MTEPSSLYEDTATPVPVGRLAPSPTGALHLGNARSFLLAWLSIRSQGGRLLLRMEDIDSPRVKPWTVQETIDTLRWLGIDWDAGPENGGTTDSIPLTQSLRLERYAEIIHELVDSGVIYRCYCTRREIDLAASAPHEQSGILEGTRYPGTCRELQLPGTRERYAWRWRLSDEEVSWRDNFCGEQRANPFRQLGDFVAARQDSIPAYQLAVVTDDNDMNVTEVVRGDDLLFSTYRQLAILEHFSWTPPTYYHVPLMVGHDGRRLAKRHGDTRIAALKDLGISPCAVVGYLAWSCGLVPEPMPITAADLVGSFCWDLEAQPTTVVHDDVVLLLKRLSR